MGVEDPAVHKDQPSLLKLNGVNAGGIEQGCPGPLGLMHLSVMVWVINHQPSPRFTGLALRRACLPTQQMAPDKVNEASLASPKLSPSPSDHHLYNKKAQPGLVTTASVRPDLQFWTMSSTTGT